MDNNILINEREFNKVDEDELFDPYELIENAIRNYYKLKHEFIELNINRINNSGIDIHIKGKYLIKENKLDNSSEWNGEFDILIDEYFKIKRQIIN